MQARRRYESPRQLARQSTILKCARQMLSERGYDGMTMRDLARTARVAPATLYNLYASKDALILAALIDLLDEIGSRAVYPGDDGLDPLLHSVGVIGQQIQSTPEYAQTMARLLFKLESEHPMVDVLFGRLYRHSRWHLQMAQRAGHLPADVDADVVARHLTGQGWGVILLWIMGYLPLEGMVTERLRSYLMTLAGITTGATRRRLLARLQALDAPHLSKA